jgi:hypothetical protein
MRRREAYRPLAFILFVGFLLGAVGVLLGGR